MFIHPNILHIIEGSNTITSSLASRLIRNVIMFAETYGKYNHYLSKTVSLPVLTLAKILEMVNCRWCTRILDKDYSSLKSILNVLNFCSTPENQADYRQCVDMDNRLVISLREEYPVQHIEHSKSKNMGSFIRGR